EINAGSDMFQNTVNIIVQYNDLHFWMEQVFTVLVSFFMVKGHPIIQSMNKAKIKLCFLRIALFISNHPGSLYRFLLQFFFHFPFDVTMFSFHIPCRIIDILEMHDLRELSK